MITYVKVTFDADYSLWIAQLSDFEGPIGDEVVTPGRNMAIVRLGIEMKRHPAQYCRPGRRLGKLVFDTPKPGHDAELFRKGMEMA